MRLFIIIAFVWLAAFPTYARPALVGPGPDLVIGLPTSGNTGNFAPLVDGAGNVWFAYRDTETATAVLYRRDTQGTITAVITEQGQSVAYGTPELNYLPDGRAIFSTTNRDGGGGASSGSVWFIDERFGWVRASWMSRASVLPMVNR